MPARSSPVTQADARARLPYVSPGRFARRRFGAPVFRVVVDAGFSCPVRDGRLSRGGCLFCSIDGFRPPTSRPHWSLAEQVRRALPRLRARYPRAQGHLIYFQPYTNTYGDPRRLARLLAEARGIEGTLGISLATRPDALPPEMLGLLAEQAREGFLQVELGIQSTDERALEIMERHHTWRDAQRAIAALRERDIRVGAQMILGTPWESRASQLRGAARISRAGVEAVKLHQLQLLRGSRLAARGPAATLRLPSATEYVTLAADFLERLAPEIVVERLVARAPRALLIAPRWESTPA
ncbi:MAG: TIGR01212 family radical SAM protein, partial [Candidatus Eisenbacteria bacterium]|nr:TIGR01212 family radical SAM protein [Candidatus Eisenbacteria bacterium]